MNSRYETPSALQHDAHTLADDARALLAATAEVGDEKVAEARKRLEAALTETKNAYARIQDRAIQSARATDQAVRSHPYESIAIAFGVGALVGFLVSRR